MSDFIFGLLCGAILGLILGMIVMHAGFISAVRSASKEKEKEDPDDWWKRGEPAPWDQ
jgi:F0F1-type ATP synthase assembly protein I